MKNSTVAGVGSALTSADTRPREHASGAYTRCSAQSVPSWSKVAIRSEMGTKLGLALVVGVFADWMMALLAAPPFQDGSGSDGAEVRNGRQQDGHSKGGRWTRRAVQRLRGHPRTDR